MEEGGRQERDLDNPNITDVNMIELAQESGTRGSPRDIIVMERRFYTQDELDKEFPRTLPETDSLFRLLKQRCRCSRSCMADSLLGFVPIVGFLRSYSWSSNLCPDLMSGLSVGFLQLPQGLGYGLMADLTPVHGLYTALFSVLVYLFFGTSPHVSMGTNAVVALLSASIIEEETSHQRKEALNDTSFSPAQLLNYKVGVSTAATMLEGVILIAMGLLRMGFLTNYMSNSFIGGFSFAGAVHITISQIVKFFHLKVAPQSGPGKLIRITVDIARKIKDTNLADVLVGVVCGALILGIREFNRRHGHRLKAPIPAELVVVALSTLVSHLADLNGRFNVDVVGDIPQGLPSPSIPPVEVMVRIVPKAIVHALLIFVLTITLAKLTAKLHIITIDDNQELVAYGMCQVVGSFFQSFSSSISPPRTMMLSSQGVRSTLHGVSTVIFLLLVLLAAGPLFASLPIAMLAIMIIVAMKDLLLQVGEVPRLWYVNKGDLVIWLLTVLFSVLGDLDLGLLAGTLTSMLTILAYSQLARGTLLGKAAGQDLYLTMDRQGIQHIPEIRIFRFDSQLHFASAERFKSEIYRCIFDPTSVTHKDHLEIKVSDHLQLSQLEPSLSRRKRMMGHAIKDAINYSVQASGSSPSTTSIQHSNFEVNQSRTNLQQSEEKENNSALRQENARINASRVTSVDVGNNTSMGILLEDVSNSASRGVLLEDINSASREILLEEVTNDTKGIQLKEVGNSTSVGIPLEVIRNNASREIPREDISKHVSIVETRSTSKVRPLRTLEDSLEDTATVRFVIVDCSTMTYVDLTGVEMLHLIITQFSRAGVAIYLTDIPATTLAILNRMDFFKHEDYSHVYLSVTDAIHGILSLTEQEGIVKSFA